MFKKSFLILFIAVPLFTSAQQNIDDLNKKELRQVLLDVQRKKDSLEMVSIELSKRKSDLEVALSDLKSAFGSSEMRRKELETQLAKTTESLTALQGQVKVEERQLVQLEGKLKGTESKVAEARRYDSVLTQKNLRLEGDLVLANKRIMAIKDSIASARFASVELTNRNISVLQDSISSLQKKISLLQVNSPKPANPKDFLNKFFAKPFPLNNNRFSMMLSKVIVGKFDDRNYYDENRVVVVPEHIDVNGVGFTGVRGQNSLQFASGGRWYLPSTAYYELSNEQLNGMLPQIEVLKNKLVTFKYQRGTEENFLLNVKEGVLNNYRQTLDFEMASESVKSDGSKNTEQDIVWRVYVIGNESYIALSAAQLLRIGLPVGFIEVSYVEGRTIQKRYLSPDETLYDYNQKTTGNGVFCFRKQTSYVSQIQYLGHNQLIFLFKLNELPVK